MEKSMIPAVLLCYDGFTNICWWMTLNPRKTLGEQIQSIIPSHSILFLEISPIFTFDTYVAFQYKK